ncbi:serine hydrolase domain-containing protein [Roseisolibacter agri]|uniref:Serine hydrolase n=1 Tax=Roseisolibacter agri TaxID=2014610 RepID=A0AA37Q849_9BACT|nr:serine hydrolase domain-containing protein [Roseisolibacter agri]GLC26452.1 serine hydrolase [Roseisolibacter agri]
MRRVCVVVALLALTRRADGQQALSRARLRAADAALRALTDSGFSGVALVATGTTVRLERAYAARGGAVARPTTGSAFWIASMTKGFTAAAVLRLAEHGRLSLADTVGRFLATAPADKRAITVRQLLTHTSGIDGRYAGGGIQDRDRAVAAILAQPLAFAPGTGYRYMDDDYELLAAIVEVATRRSWADVVEAELLVPAGLSRTGFWCRHRSGAPSPIAGIDARRARCGGPADWGHRGANGMSSTARDLLRWTAVLRDGPVLGAASRASLAAPQVFVRREPPADVSYGYGVRVLTRNGRVTEVVHSGSGDDGHTGMVRVFPDGLTVIVLSNAGAHAGTTWSAHAARRVVAALRPATVTR